MNVYTTKKIEQGAIRYSDYRFDVFTHLKIVDRRHAGLGFSAFFYTNVESHGSGLPVMEVGKTPAEALIKLATNKIARAYVYRLLRLAKREQRLASAGTLRLIA